MSTLQLARDATRAAHQRRAHLSARAVLAGLFRLTACVARLSFRVRGALDARGGAYDPAVA